MVLISMKPSELVQLVPTSRFRNRGRGSPQVQVEFPGKLCDAAAPKEGFRQLRAMALFARGLRDGELEFTDQCDADIC